MILKAFYRPDKEKVRGTLHSHWLLWVKNYHLLHKMMHDCNRETWSSTMPECLFYIYKVMSARHGDFEVIATHACVNGGEKMMKVDKLL